MTPSQPARRRVTESEPEDRSKRNLVVLLGALVGIGAGVVAALFIAPPLIDHFFGTADIDLGQPYERAHCVYRVTAVTRKTIATNETDATYDINFEIMGSGVGFTANDFEIEMTNGTRIQPLEYLSPGGGLHGIRISVPAHVMGEPRILHVPALEARFHLIPREKE